MVALGYPIGVLLFVLLYFIGIKICEFFDPYPPYVPSDVKYDDFEMCNIQINGKSYKCLKTTHTRKTYGYSADCDVIEWDFKHFKYELQEPITEIPNFIDKTCRTLIVNDNGNNIECYMADNLKCFICSNPIKADRIYKYRKPAILRKFTLKSLSSYDDRLSAFLSFSHVIIKANVEYRDFESSSISLSYVISGLVR